MIRADGIDILVDLSGHTAGNRQAMFALKPAPVQVSYLGDTMTTGLAAMDYKMTDAHITPPDTKEGFTEILATLPDSFACYYPLPDSPAIGPLSALATGRITFGCFNNLAKVTPSVIALWSAVLHAVPGSRLMLKTKALNDTATCERVVEKFAACDIARDRLVLRGHVAGMGDHLATYNEIDVALDTFPYGGGTTTIEALWMGVPVISLVGDRSTARLGLSFLSTVGLGALATGDPEGFVMRAQELAGNLPRLAEIRSKLRHRTAVSPLCDATQFAGNVENLYRAMWRRWCESQQDAASNQPEGATA
jgi:predicted O-linked N-acetylglucosamine transferase (SPINDLY family)